MGKVILVIDDDEEVLRVYKTVLSDFAQVKVAQDMSQARTQLDGVDLILLDYYLRKGEISFQDIVPELKRVAPILVCSGTPDPAVRTLGLSLGAAGYWHKSTGFVALREKVQAVLAE